MNDDLRANRLLAKVYEKPVFMFVSLFLAAGFPLLFGACFRRRSELLRLNPLKNFFMKLPVAHLTSDEKIPDLSSG